MLHRHRIVLSVLCLLCLAGCVSREQADAKLTKGCVAGAKNFIAEDSTVKSIEKSRFKASGELGKGYREVIVDVIESDGLYEPEKQYKCVFFEEFGLFNMTHNASIYQLEVDGEIFGKRGDEIIGSLEEHMSLIDTVQEAME